MTYDGDTVWAKNLNISVGKGLVINSIYQYPDGCIAALGDRATTGPGPTIHEPFFAYFDSLFDFPLNVGMEQLPQAYTVTVTPNPFSDELTVSVKNNEQVNHITLTSIAGQVLRKIDYAGNENEIHIKDLNTLSKGIYILKLESNDSIRFFKIIKL